MSYIFNASCSLETAAVNNQFKTQLPFVLTGLSCQQVKSGVLRLTPNNEQELCLAEITKIKFLVVKAVQPVDISFYDTTVTTTQTVNDEQINNTVITPNYSNAPSRFWFKLFGEPGLEINNVRIKTTSTNISYVEFAEYMIGGGI
jgi:hypothetical protein